MNTKVLILLGLVAVVAADKRPSTSYGPPKFDSSEHSSEHSFEHSSEHSFEHNSDESFEPVKYRFEFGVHDDSTSASFEHQEARDEDETQGSYTVQLPDGRRQTVRYFVNGDSGYVAEVSYVGEAQYPDSNESRQNSASDSHESGEFLASNPQQPRPTYAAPDSFESGDFQSYSPPSSSYGVPL